MNDYPIVALSRSAGGLDALIRVLAPLAAGLPALRPSADLLLTTLALAVGRRAVAVVLSGQGQDAATGATAVHRFGGTVIVSSPQTSARSAMPRATMIGDDITDHVVPLDDRDGLLLAQGQRRDKSARCSQPRLPPPCREDPRQLRRRPVPRGGTASG